MWIQFLEDPDGYIGDLPRFVPSSTLDSVVEMLRIAQDAVMGQVSVKLKVEHMHACMKLIIQSQCVQRQIRSTSSLSSFTSNTIHPYLHLHLNLRWTLRWRFLLDRPTHFPTSKLCEGTR